MSNKNPIIGIVSCDLSGAIGLKTGRLLYKVKEDMQYFKNVTTKGFDPIIVMGGRTYESLDGELPGRRHVVLCSNTAIFRAKHIKTMSEQTLLFDDCDELANFIIAENAKGCRVCIIGGAYVFEKLIWLVEELHLTVFNIKHRARKEDKAFLTCAAFWNFRGPCIRDSIGSHPPYKRYRLEPKEPDMEVRKKSWFNGDAEDCHNYGQWDRLSLVQTDDEVYEYGDTKSTI